MRLCGATGPIGDPISRLRTQEALWPPVLRCAARGAPWTRHQSGHPREALDGLLGGQCPPCLPYDYLESARLGAAKCLPRKELHHSCLTLYTFP